MVRKDNQNFIKSLKGINGNGLENIHETEGEYSNTGFQWNR